MSTIIPRSTASRRDYPEGEYGGGTLVLWDRVTWDPIGDTRASYKSGKLRFRFNGEKLQGMDACPLLAIAIRKV
jgi:hypothetical protein